MTDSNSPSGTPSGQAHQQDSGSPLLAVLFIGQLITILAIAGLGWLVQNEMASLRVDMQRVASSARAAAQPQRAQEPAEPVVFSDWKSIIRSHNPTIGPADAKVTLIEFSDFQCPFCNRFYEQTFKQLLIDYDGKLRIVFKHLPLTQIHPMAESAAVAMQCAHKDGKAWALHDKLFENFRDITDENIKSFAKQVGLGGSFVSCYESRATKAEVDQDSQDAVRAGARGTPAFFINGKFLSGAQPLQNFKREIDAMLQN